jgi:hypothetical protein
MILLSLLLACATAPVPESSPELVAAPQTDCSTAKNTCPDYSTAWVDACPKGERCIAFVNACPEPVALAYQVGCNGDGTPGAPQCNCTTGPTVAAGESTFWQITDANYASCLPSWEPACLTAGLAVLANPTTASCTTGTRFEFTAGNTADVYNHFDSYNLDVEKDWYAVPVHVQPDLTCAVDHASHDCRPLWCNAADCPDAYQTPTTGGCADGRSPQASCQDTFGKTEGYTVTFCPTSCATTGSSCPSCQDTPSCE